jgi:hypothetical protein
MQKYMGENSLPSQICKKLLEREIYQTFEDALNLFKKHLVQSELAGHLCSGINKWSGREFDQIYIKKYFYGEFL